MEGAKKQSKLGTWMRTGLSDSIRWKSNPLKSDHADETPGERAAANVVNPVFKLHSPVPHVSPGDGDLSSIPGASPVTSEDGEETPHGEVDVINEMKSSGLNDKEINNPIHGPKKSRASMFRKATSKASLISRTPTAPASLLSSTASKNPMQDGVTGKSRSRMSIAALQPGRGIPVREGLQAVYKVYRDKNIKEGFLFMIMFAFFLLNVYSVNDVASEYQAGAALRNHLVNEDMVVFDTWNKNFNELWTHGDVFEWVMTVLYPAVYLQDYPLQLNTTTEQLIPLVGPYDMTVDPNASIPIVLGNYQAIGGVRLRQVRVARDSCVERRNVGHYTISSRIFNATAINSDGSVGVQGGSVLRHIFAGYDTPAAAITPDTGKYADGGPSASFRSQFAFGCMNYFASTGTCPSDMNVDKMTADVLINTNPVADLAQADSAPLATQTVRLAGRVKCSMHNITRTLAESVYAGFNPLANKNFSQSVIAPADDSEYVQACLGRFDSLDGSCADTFSSSVEQKAPFVGAAGTVYQYTAGAAQESLASMLGWGPQLGYGTGGYLTYLSNDPEYAAMQIARLQWDHWIDKETRAVTADINLWNANTRMASTFRVVFEFFPSGYITRYLRIYTYKVLDHDVGANFIIYVISACFLAFWVYFLYKECQRAWYSYNFISYFSSFRNLYVITLLILACIYTTFWVQYVFVVDMYTRYVENFGSGNYVDLFVLAEQYQTMFTLSGLLGLAFFFKLFEYLGSNKRMRAIWLTLYEARTALLAYLVGFLLLVFGFSFSGHLIFGYSSLGFHSLGASMSTLLRFPLGDFDYKSTLYDTRPALAPWFFVAFLAMIFLVSLNIAIAILTTSFETVHEATKSVDRWKETSTSIDEDVLFLLRVKVKDWSRPARRWCRRHCCRPAAPLNRSSTPGGIPTSPDSGSRDGAITEGTTVPNAVRKSAFATSFNRGLRTVSSFFVQNEVQEIIETEKDITAYRHAAKFYNMMHKCSHAAKVHNNIDLFAYLKRLYENEPDSDKLCIGADELCELTSERACGHNNHSPLCLAQLTIGAYTEMKTVISVTELTEHITPWEAMMRARHRPYKVIKINKLGAPQGRILFVTLDSRLESDAASSKNLNLNPEGPNESQYAPIDADGPAADAALYNFSQHHRLKKKLPLRQLISLEKSLRDDKRLSLVFSSQGGGHILVNDDEEGTSLETTYHLLFASAQERQDFENDILAAHQRTMLTVECEKGLEDIEAMTSKRTAAKTRERAHSRMARASSELQEGIRKTASRSTMAGNKLRTVASAAVMAQGMLSRSNSARELDPPNPTPRGTAFTGIDESSLVDSVLSSSSLQAATVAAERAGQSNRPRASSRSPSPARQLPSFFGNTTSPTLGGTSGVPDFFTKK